MLRGKSGRDDSYPGHAPRMRDTDIASLASFAGNVMLDVDLNVIRVINGCAGIREALIADRLMRRQRAAGASCRRVHILGLIEAGHSGRLTN